MNDIYNMDFTTTLPSVIKNDKTLNALAGLIAKELHKNVDLIKKNVIYASIEELPENVLDLLAYDFKLDWYDHNADLDTKIDLIKNGKRVSMSFGTKWAVENVMKSYFKDGEVIEWFQYGGKPYHFMIETSDSTMNNEKYDDFLYMLDRVKRKSAVLESINITLPSELNYKIGIGTREVTRETYVIN